jgi:transposase
MLRVGFDLGKRKSWIVIENETGKIVLNKKVQTTRPALTAIFSSIERAEVLLEASTSSEWVARLLESFGHLVHVADPNFGPMYANLDKRIKNDERDANGLLYALSVGAFRLAVRRSDEELHIKTLLSSRDALVRSRTKLINRTRATLQRFGIVEDKSEAADYADAVRRDCLDERLQADLEPTLRVLDELTKEIGELDEALEREAMKNPIVVRLEKIPGIGPITALAFVYALSDAKRFKNADAAASYLGLVPSLIASGELEIRGRITKRGDSVARALLHGAAGQIMRSTDPRVAELRNWALDIVKRRGGKKKGGRGIARTALARRLARIMWAMWRDGTDFNATRTAAVIAKEELAAAAE